MWHGSTEMFAATRQIFSLYPIEPQGGFRRTRSLMLPPAAGWKAARKNTPLPPIAMECHDNTTKDTKGTKQRSAVW
jgi:hypothetical protein